MSFYFPYTIHHPLSRSNSVPVRVSSYSVIYLPLFVPNLGPFVPFPGYSLVVSLIIYVSIIYFFVRL